MGKRRDHDDRAEKSGETGDGVMPTDEERREVVAKLRELVADWFDDGEFYDRGEVEDVLGLATDDGAWYEAAGVRRLADLIEPEERTCRMEPACEGSVVCSACRTEYTSRWLHEGEYVERYCPNCGARVEEEQ